MIEFMPPVRIKDYLLAKRDSANVFTDVALTLRGRDAIALAVEHFALGPEDTVLLPGYLCDTIIGPFMNRKCRLIYYDIEGDFSVNPSVLAPLFVRYRPKVLYIIHYFGFLHSNLPRLSQLCKQYSVLLWEDHAHSAISRFSNQYADAMIFSFRKVLPVPDGGGLWTREKPVPSPSVNRTWQSDIMSACILAKRRVWGSSKRLREVQHRLARRHTNSVNSGTKSITVRPISRVSGRAIRSADVETIFSIRRRQFCEWVSLLAGSGFRPVCQTLRDGVCPQGCPIWVSNPMELSVELEHHNVFLKIHWPLPPIVEETCPASWSMSKKIVTLPVYPGLSAIGMRTIVDLLKDHGKP